MANITFSEGSGLNDSIYGKSQAPIRMLIEDKAEAFEEKSMLEEIFMMDKSTHWAEKYTSMTDMEDFDPVGENGAYPITGMEEGYSQTLEHVTWKNSFSISREIMEDSKTLDLKKKPSKFIKSYYRTREQLGAALLGSAYKASTPNITFRGKKFYTKGADGKQLFAADHPSKVRGAAQSNRFAGLFSADNLAKLETKMQNFHNDNGELGNIVPNTIIIPNVWSLKKDVLAAVGADKDPDTANNGFNYLFGRWRVIVWSYLNQYMGIDESNNNVPWILADIDYNKEDGGAIFTDRTPLDVRSTIDENTDANVWRGYARFTAGFNDWRAFAIAGVDGGSDL